LTELGQGWYVYTRKRFIPPKQGLDHHFQNLVGDFRGGECFKFFTAINKEKGSVRNCLRSHKYLEEGCFL
jgi:hypothetical protein